MLAYFLQELAELSAFGVSGAQILFGCHHCADAASVCILSWAVHLPPLLWPDGLHRGTQAQSWIQSPHACRQTCKINSVLMMALLWNCGTQSWLSWHLCFDPHRSSGLVSYASTASTPTTPLTCKKKSLSFTSTSCVRYSSTVYLVNFLFKQYFLALINNWIVEIPPHLAGSPAARCK